MIQFIQNAATQYDVGIALSTVGETIQLSILIEPVIKTITTGFQYLTDSGIDPTERVVLVTQVAAFSYLSAIATTTDPAVNVGVVGGNVAFLTYMMKILEASNNGNQPFILPYKNGQGKVVLLIILVSTMGFVLLYATYYATKQYLKLLKSCYNMGVRSVEKNFTKSPSAKLSHLQLK